MDILSANAAGDDLTVFFASAPGAFPFAPSGHLTDSAMAQPSSLQAVDVNGDGSCDIVSGNPGTDNLTIFFQRRPGEFLLPRAIGGTGFTDSPVGLVVVDFDGDGEPDLISAQPELDNTAVFYGGR
jgi:hypothetical protein